MPGTAPSDTPSPNPNAVLPPRSDIWFGRTFPALGDAPVAYFSAEFGVDPALPIYSGGLGIVAGDLCRAASELGVPVVAVGLLYRRGSFGQQIGDDGWQRAVDPVVDPDSLALRRCTGPDGATALATLRVARRHVAVGAWELALGRTRLILLDAALEENHPEDRRITDRLYGNGPDHRLRQEWVLGVGGVRVLRALGIAPGAWHANEGHTAFMMVERVRERIARGQSLGDAVPEVRARTIFTTHTPVAAGHDVFAVELMDHVCGLQSDPPLERDTFLGFGRHPTAGNDHFHMTAAALRLAGFANGVSRLHGAVARTQWSVLWNRWAPAMVPIDAITNGVHVGTWMASSMRDLVAEALGADWVHADPASVEWSRVLSIDDEALWRAHRRLADDLFARWIGGGPEPRALTLGFARRFAAYKRADLLLRDPDRLERLLKHPGRPVQIVFAGKAHPKDHDGLMVLQRVWKASRDRRFAGRIVFLEGYGMELARALVQGVDLWLNLPRVPLEACGTSGMKAALNGVPQLATLDGWWAEGFTGRNGWALPHPRTLGLAADDDVDAHDHEALFNQLEREVVPCFHDRDAAGLPRAWISRMRHALAEAAMHFTAARMVRDYAERAWVPALRGSGFDSVPPS